MQCLSFPFIWLNICFNVWSSVWRKKHYSIYHTRTSIYFFLEFHILFWPYNIITLLV
jgi:hypothetical protein